MANKESVLIGFQNITSVFCCGFLNAEVMGVELVYGRVCYVKGLLRIEIQNSICFIFLLIFMALINGLVLW